MNIINFYFSNISFREACGLIISAIGELIWPFRKLGHDNKRKFELEARTAIGVTDVIAVPTNRSGLFALLSALNIGEGDEVIVTGFTCSAVVEPILQRGATPVYVDITVDSFCIDPELLMVCISPHVRVIVLQHTYGFAGPIEDVIKIARKQGLFVIEDCALAFGSKHGGRWLGTFGDASVWSFELSKTLSVGWGGLVGINLNDELAEQLRMITEGAGFQGRWLAAQRLLQGGLSGLLYHHRAPYLFRRYVLPVLFKFRIFRSSAETPASDLRLPSDLQWKWLLRQLRRLDGILADSKKAQQSYEGALSSRACQSPSMRLQGTDSYLIRFPMLVRDVRRFVGFFLDRDIEIGRWFSNPVSNGRESPSKYGYVSQSCPVAEQVCAHIVNLPLHGRLTRSQVALVTDTLEDYLLAYPDEIGFIQGNVPLKPPISEAR